MRVRYSPEFINRVLEHFLQFGASNTVAKFQVSYATLYRWKALYELHGSEVFNNMSRQRCTYDFQFRLNAVKYIVDNGLSLISAACKLRINQVTLATWVRVYKELGSKGLSKLQIRTAKHTLEPMTKNRNNSKPQNVNKDVNKDLNNGSEPVVIQHLTADTLDVEQVTDDNKPIKEHLNDYYDGQ